MDLYVPIVVAFLSCACQCARIENFKIKNNSKILETAVVLKENIMFSIIHCIMECTQLHVCCSASYDSNSGLCRLYQHCGLLTGEESGVFILTKDVPEAVRCLPGWLPFDRHCYNFNCAQLQCITAREACESLNGYLMVIDSPEENNWIKGANPCYGVSPVMWTGLTDSQTEGTWVSSHDHRDAVFLPWSPGEPNNMNGDLEEDCAAINDLYLHDNSCTENPYYSAYFPYVCERLEYIIT